MKTTPCKKDERGVPLPTCPLIDKAIGYLEATIRLSKFDDRDGVANAWEYRTNAEAGIEAMETVREANTELRRLLEEALDRVSELEGEKF